MYRIIAIVFFIFLLALVPLLMIFNSAAIKLLLGLKDDDSFKVILAFFPLVYSLIILLFNVLAATTQKLRKDRSDEVSLVNSRTDEFNRVLAKTNNRLNMLCNEHRQVTASLEVLRQSPQVSNIIDYWKSNVGKELELVNSAKFREHLHRELSILVGTLDHVYEGQFVLKQMRYLSIYHTTMDRPSIEDQIFIFGIRNFVEVEERDRQVMSAFGVFESMAPDVSVFQSYQVRRSEYSDYYDRMVESGSLRPDTLVSILEVQFVVLFRFLDVLAHEILLIDEMQKTLAETYGKYHDIQRKRFKKLNDIVKISRSSEVDGFIELVDAPTFLKNLKIT